MATLATFSNQIIPEKSHKYQCEICHYNTEIKKDYMKHLLTIKHKINESATKHEEFVPKNPSLLLSCENCNKTYKDKTGIWRHKKKCSMINPPVEIPTHPSPAPPPHSSTEDMQMTLILELVKQNQEFKNLLIQQSNQMMEQNKTMIDVAKHSQGNNNNTLSHNNNNNKTFNLNFFLNETCKDAMNMKDFIKSLEMTLPELENMGELGFAEGMSRLFVDRLNKLDITKRPIHCSDVKREIIHIKDDNKWERDNANLDRLRKIIKQLTLKNILKVDDWKKANQGCTEYNSRKADKYLRINMEAIGPVDDAEVKRDFGKIIRRVAESTAIDKKYL
jgi:NAD-dependent dihydropyrimidine dehydrogenase PreA subunit